MSFALDMETMVETRICELTINSGSSYKLSSITSFLSILDFYFIYANYVAAKNTGLEFDAHEDWTIDRIARRLTETRIKYCEINSTLLHINRNRHTDLEDFLSIAIKLQGKQLSLTPEVMEISQGSIKITIILPIILISLCGFEFNTDGVDINIHEKELHMNKTNVKIGSLGEGIQQIANGIQAVRRSLRSE